MSDPLNRRRFGRNLLATGAGAIFAGAGFHVSLQAVLAVNERRLLETLTSLFPRILIEKVSEGKQRVVEAAACIDDLGAFLDPDQRHAALPDAHIRAEGNTLRFRDSDTDYRIRLLLPDDFASRTGKPLQSA